MRICIKIADLTAGVVCTHDMSHVCAGYALRSDIDPDFTLRAEEDYLKKLEKYFPCFFEELDSREIEQRAIFGDFCIKVTAFNAAVLHSALISYKGQGVAFAALSGTGKSTHIGLWKKLFPQHVEVINGDKPLITLRDGGFFASGTPWCGKEGWNTNKTVPLKAICFIERAQENSIAPLCDNAEILRRLFCQLIMPDETPELMMKYLSFANTMMKTVPFYLLRCNVQDEAAQVARKGLFGDEDEA